MSSYPGLPARYRTLQPIEAGEIVTEEQSRRISIPLSLFAAAGILGIWWLSASQLKIDRATRARRNPRRRR